VRIGIATGIVVAGDLLGEGAAREHAVVGETPNLAARLQGVAAPGEVVVSANTHHLVEHLFEFRDLGPQHLKGFAAPVSAYAITGERSSGSRFEARRAALLGAMVGRDRAPETLLKECGARSVRDMALIAALLGIDGVQRYGPLTLTPQQQRLGTFEALTGLLGDVARIRPLLWTIEDVQWIDPTTLELIDLCLERIANLPVLILASARPDFHDAFGSRPNLTRLPL